MQHKLGVFVRKQRIRLPMFWLSQILRSLPLLLLREQCITYMYHGFLWQAGTSSARDSKFSKSWQYCYMLQKGGNPFTNPVRFWLSQIFHFLPILLLKKLRVTYWSFCDSPGPHQAWPKVLTATLWHVGVAARSRQQKVASVAWRQMLFVVRHHSCCDSWWLQSVTRS